MTNNLPGNRIEWTPDEEAALRAAYGTGGIRAAVAAIATRSESAIYRHASKLGIVRKRHWTDVEDAKLRALWDGDSTLEEVAETLSRTPQGVLRRARDMGLPQCPARWEHLRDAARRAGYSRDQLLDILRWSGSTVRRRLLADPRYGHGPRARRRFIVLAADVDAAVADWLETETVESAARRLGITGKKLARWLGWAGVERQRRQGRPKFGARPHWRIRPEDIEAALAAGRERGEEARRHDRRRGSTAPSSSAGKVAEQGGTPATDDRAQFVGPRRPEANPRGNQPEPARLGGRALDGRTAA